MHELIEKILSEKTRTSNQKREPRKAKTENQINLMFMFKLFKINILNN